MWITFTGYWHNAVTSKSVIISEVAKQFSLLIQDDHCATGCSDDRQNAERTQQRADAVSTHTQVGSQWEEGAKLAVSKVARRHFKDSAVWAGASHGDACPTSNRWTFVALIGCRRLPLVIHEKLRVMMNIWSSHLTCGEWVGWSGNPTQKKDMKSPLVFVVCGKRVGCQVVMKSPSRQPFPADESIFRTVYISCSANADTTLYVTTATYSILAQSLHPVPSSAHWTSETLQYAAKWMLGVSVPDRVRCFSHRHQFRTTHTGSVNTGDSFLVVRRPQL
jgi:hypothetical protein